MAVINILRQEHRNIERLLLVLERELAIFARGGRPDYEVIHAVIAYFQVYPDGALNVCVGSRRQSRACWLVGNSCGKPSITSFATSLSTNGVILPWKSVISFRPRSTRYNLRTGPRSLQD